MAGAADFLPPFSFCAAIISCLLRSASSRAFFFSRASASFFSDSSFLSSLLLGELFLLLNSDFLPLSLLLLQSLEFLFFLTPFFSDSSFLSFSSSDLFCWASFFSCSILISFLLACFSFSLLSSSSSLLLSIGECTLLADHSARSSWLYLRPKP